MAIGAIVAGLARGIGGAALSNQRKQKNKGLIGKAYAQGRERLNLMQGDTRQGFGEGLVARGLHLGGNVRAGGPVKPEFEGADATLNRTVTPRAGMPIGRPGGPFSIRDAYTITPKTNPAVALNQATDLGGQQQADLGREQQLEQNEMRTAYDNAITNNDAAGFNDVVNNLAAGVETGTGLSDALGNLNSIQSAFGQPMRPPTPYPNAYGGIDPVLPLERGAWAMPKSSADFNVFDDDFQNRRG